MFLNDPLSTANQSMIPDKGLIPSSLTPLSPLTQEAVRRAERASNTPSEIADMDQ